MTVFHFEAPRPEDLGLGTRSEAELVSAACKLAGHPFHSFRPLNAQNLAEQLNYVFSWVTDPDSPATKPQFSLHISGHGDDTGLQVGTSDLTWTSLCNLLDAASSATAIPYMLVISGCGKGRARGLATAFNGLSRPPVYVFTFENEVEWQDAAHASSLLYRFLPKVLVSDRAQIQKIVTQVRDLGFGSLVYYRWDGRKFKVFPAEGA